MIKEWNLNKDWRFRLGDEPRPKQMSHAQAYQFAQAGSREGFGGINCDDSDWEIVQLPHDYMVKTGFYEDEIRSHGYRKPENAWYRKRFLLPEEYKGKHLLLRFNGIAMQAKIYLNGSLLARSHTAYVPIEVDITDRAFFGDRVNTLAVEVDGYSLEGWFYEGNGIYRDVLLTASEPLHIKYGGYHLNPVQVGENWRLEYDITLQNSAFEGYEKARVAVELYDGEDLFARGESDEVICEASGEVSCRGAFDVAGVQLWDVESPKLYKAVIKLLKDGSVYETEQCEIGFRSFTVDASRGFFLNGKPIKLKGTCSHQDHAGIGEAVPDAIYEYRMRLIKTLGCNAHRNVHSMATDAFLSICDRLGILVVDENRRFESTKEGIAMVQSMVRAARNHPCVVLYSLFNEEALQATREGANIFRRMCHAVRELDDTRLITGAMGGGVHDEHGTAPHMDVVGVNYSLSVAEEYHRNHPDVPVFGSENCSAVMTRGCQASDAALHLCGDLDEDVVDWGQSICETWDFCRKHDWYGGIHVWTGFDYRGEPTPYDWPSVSSFFGVLDVCGFMKNGGYLLKGCYSDEPLVHICVDWEHEGTDTVRVCVVSNCEQVELFVNGVSLGIKDADCCIINEWDVPFVSGRLTAVGYKGQKAMVSDERVTPKAAAKILIEPQKEFICDDGKDALCVNFLLVDEDGNPVVKADRELRFTVEGGILLGVGNGDPNSHEAEHLPKRKSFYGRAQAVIGSVLGMKELTVRVEADGIAPCYAVIPVKAVKAPEYLASMPQRAVHGVRVTALTFAERPDITMNFAEFDMNSLEWVIFDTDSYKPVFKDGWKLYTVNITASKVGTELHVLLHDVAAKHIVAAVDGVVLLDCAHEGGAVEFSFEKGEKREYELRLLLQGTGSESGIRGGIAVEG